MHDVRAIREVAQAGKDRDPRWYRIHRRASIYLTLALFKVGARPNHVSFVMMVIGAAGAVLLADDSPGQNLAGFLLVYLSFLLDKVDGELARLRGQQSAQGILLDRFHHRIIEPALFASAAIHAYRTEPATWVLLSGPVIMLLANMIEENQHIAPYIFYKRTREGGRIDPRPPRTPRGLDRVARALRPLKGFRMLIVALPLVYASYLAEVWTGLPVTAWYLGASLTALAAYYLFQCWFYFVFQLDAEMAEEAAMHRASETDGGGPSPVEPRVLEPVGPARGDPLEHRAVPAERWHVTPPVLPMDWVISTSSQASRATSPADAPPGTPRAGGKRS